MFGIERAFVVLFITHLAACGPSDPVMATFNNSEAGAALKNCFSSGGTVTTKSFSSEKYPHVVSATLEKDSLVPGKSRQRITLQYAVNLESKQVGFIGAEVEGVPNLNRMILGLEMGLMCGGTLSAKILAGEYVDFTDAQKLQNLR